MKGKFFAVGKLFPSCKLSNLYFHSINSENWWESLAWIDYLTERWARGNFIIDWALFKYHHHLINSTSITVFNEFSSYSPTVENSLYFESKRRLKNAVINETLLLSIFSSRSLTIFFSHCCECWRFNILENITLFQNSARF